MVGLLCESSTIPSLRLNAVTPCRRHPQCQHVPAALLCNLSKEGGGTRVN
jgi:hypothetical protein